MIFEISADLLFTSTETPDSSNQSVQMNESVTREKTNEISISGVDHEDGGVTNAAAVPFELCALFSSFHLCPAQHLQLITGKHVPLHMQSSVYVHIKFVLAGFCAY